MLPRFPVAPVPVAAATVEGDLTDTVAAAAVDLVAGQGCLVSDAWIMCVCVRVRVCACVYIYTKFFNYAKKIYLETYRILCKITVH